MEKKTVLVGMSGGVDSAAAALLLEQAGYAAIGCTLKLYRRADGGCGSEQEAEDARKAAQALGIDFYLMDESDAFCEKVIGNFVSTYCAGATPNPCIECNRCVKFTSLLKRADELGADYIATGHYARVRYEESLNRWQLLRGECALLQKDFSAAAPYFHRAEGRFPEETAPKLEACYRELQDFRRAYEYACKQK